ncbi:hypothetical protein [Streptomyces sp. NPDC001153]
MAVAGHGGAMYVVHGMGGCGTSHGQRSVLGEVAVRLVEEALPERGTQAPLVRRPLALLAPHGSRLLETAPGELSAALGVRLVRQVYETADCGVAMVLPHSVADRAGARLGEDHPVALDARDVVGRPDDRIGAAAHASSTPPVRHPPLCWCRWGRSPRSSCTE